MADGSKPGALDRLVIDTAEDGLRAVGFLKQRGVDWTRSFLRNVPADDDPRQGYVSASLKSVWRNVQPLPDTPEARTRLARAWDRFLDITRILRREGVRFLAGTDIGATNIYPGFSLHDELGWLVRAGFTPLDVISIATRNSAESLGRLRDLGTIEPGKRADLVLLEADPLADIGNTRKIAAVVADGRFYSKADLGALLEDVKARAGSR